MKRMYIAGITALALAGVGGALAGTVVLAQTPDEVRTRIRQEVESRPHREDQTVTNELRDAGSDVQSRTDEVSDARQRAEARLAEARQRAEAAKQQALARRADRSEKLAAKQKEVCEKHEQQINTITERISQRNQAHIDRLSDVTEKVRTFYEAQGKDLETYDALLAEVEASKAVAQQAADAVKAGKSFDCDGDAPRQAIQDFRANRLIVIDELKIYRDAVKALIAGVKGAQATDTANAEEEAR